MWFSKDDVTSFLSRQTKSFFTANKPEEEEDKESLWNDFAAQTEELIKNVTIVDENNIPISYKQPFVWILEYILQGQFTGQSQEYINLVSDHYKEAVNFFSNLETDRINSVEPKVISFNNAYNMDNV